MATTQTSTNVKIFIGPVAADTVDTLAEFEALTPYQEIKKILNIGDLGDQASEVTADYLDTGRTEVYKGIRRAPNLDIMLGYDEDDDGQDDLIAAEASPSNYAFYIELFNEGAGSPSNPTRHYFRGQVMSNMKGGFSPNSILTHGFTIAVNSAIFTKMAV
jgi:hypothetical protein